MSSPNGLMTEFTTPIFVTTWAPLRSRGRRKVDLLRRTPGGWSGLGMFGDMFLGIEWEFMVINRDFSGFLLVWWDFGGFWCNGIPCDSILWCFCGWFIVIDQQEQWTWLEMHSGNYIVGYGIDGRFSIAMLRYKRLDVGIWIQSVFSHLCFWGLGPSRNLCRFSRLQVGKKLATWRIIPWLIPGLSHFKMAQPPSYNIL